MRESLKAKRAAPIWSWNNYARDGVPNANKLDRSPSSRNNPRELGCSVIPPRKWTILRGFMTATHNIALLSFATLLMIRYTRLLIRRQRSAREIRLLRSQQTYFVYEARQYTHRVCASTKPKQVNSVAGLILAD
jgi:hypothetical protein